MEKSYDKERIYYLFLVMLLFASILYNFLSQYYSFIKESFNFPLIFAILFLLFFVFLLFRYIINIISSQNNKTSFTFKYWRKNSKALKNLTNYINEITNEKNKNFIPIENRVAVFDFDGTLFSEKSPFYIQYYLYYLKMKKDHKDLLSQEPHKSIMHKLEQSFKIRSFIEPELEYKQPEAEALIFKGKTIPEFMEYVKNFTELPSPCYNNLKLKDMFFLPMIEIINYLLENDFNIYIISGTGRFFIREIIKDHINLPYEKIIGTDMNLIENSDKNSSEIFVFGGKIIKKMCLNTKVEYVNREIGIKPVLSFANSKSDIPLCDYVLSENEYKSQIYMVVADDIEREYGIDKKNEDGSVDTSKSDNLKKMWIKNGYKIISMRDDFDTIYGKNVKKNNVCF